MRGICSGKENEWKVPVQFGFNPVNLCGHITLFITYSIAVSEHHWAEGNDLLPSLLTFPLLSLSQVTILAIGQLHLVIDFRGDRFSWQKMLQDRQTGRLLLYKSRLPIAEEGKGLSL